MAHLRFPKSTAYVLAAALAAGPVGLPPVWAQSAPGNTFEAPADFSAMVAERLPAVVGILSTGSGQPQQRGPRPQLPPGMDEFFGLPMPDMPPPGPLRSQGSGFILSPDGYVVTNNHVIEGAEGIEVILEDERRFDAELIGTDPATDIALLKISSDAELPNVTWGSSEDLQIGEWVVAIGNPFGLGGTVTAGILSARSRDINAGPYDDFLQTDAAINSGNSGGPLFDATGNVVGVNTAIFSPSGGNVGIGFAVPSQVAARIVEDLRDDGTVERGWLGVQIQPVTEDLSAALGLDDESGALIAEVTPGSPAADAGLEPGMVITEVSGTVVEDPRDLTFAVADLSVGEEIVFTVFDGGESRSVSVTIGRQPGAEQMAGTPTPVDPDTPRIGVSLAELTPELRQQLNIPADVAGLAISGVEPDSAAARAGLRRGDVIVEVGGEPVDSIETVRSAVSESAESGEPFLMRVFSNGSYGFRAISPDTAQDG